MAKNRFCKCSITLLSAVVVGVWPAVSPAAQRPRVASLLPSHTEVVLALGAEGQLVAVSDADDGLSHLPRAGGVAPRWETLVAVRPDVVLADSAHRRYQADFKRFDIPVLFLGATRARDVEAVFGIIDQVGTILGRTDEAGRLVHSLREGLAEADNIRPAGPAPSALFVVWARPLQAAGRVSLQGHLLERAGFHNIVPDTRNDMPLLSSEWVVGQRPEWIFFTSDHSPEDFASRPGWATIPAVMNKRVIRLNSDLFSRAGPRVVMALTELARLRREHP